MKKVFQLYFRYNPKWSYLYRTFTEMVSGLSSIYKAVIVPTAIAEFFIGKIHFWHLILVIGLDVVVDTMNIIILYILESFCLVKYDIRFRKSIQAELYGKMQSLSLKYYDNNQFFEKYRLASENTVSSTYALVNWITNLLRFLTSIFTSTLIVSLIDAKILVLMLVSMLLSGLVQFICVLISLKTQREMTRLGNVFDYVERVFYMKQYAVELRTSKISNVIFDIFRTNMVNTNRLLKKLLLHAFPLECIQIGMTDIVVYFTVLGYACYNIVVLKNLAVGDLVASFTGALTLYRLILNFLNSFIQLFEQKERFQYYMDFMEQEDSAPQTSDPVEAPEKEIAFRNVSFGYAEELVLHNISFTTTEGEITIDDKNVANMDPAEYRTLFTYMGQSTEILEMTIAENILMRKCETEEDRQTVCRALEQVKMLDKVMSLENSIHTVIGREFTADGVLLSGGEMQRLALARAIARKSPFLVVDEPSSHIDPIAEHDFFELLKDINKDGIVIYITHNIKYAADADQILWLEGGRIQEQGNHDSLLKRKGKYFRAYHNLYNVLRAD